MTRKFASLSVIAGIAVLASIAGLIVVSRFGETNVFSGSWTNRFGHPRAATVAEQREFMRLSLQQILEAPILEGPGSGRAATRTPQIALNAVPSRRCVPIPHTRGCGPDAAGKILMSETPPPYAKNIERAPIALRRALVQAKPRAGHLPDPGLPGVVFYNDGTTLPPDKERLMQALFRREVSGGLGHIFITWAVVSIDERTALMNIVTTGGTDAGGYAAIEVFRRDPDQHDPDQHDPDGRGPNEHDPAGWHWIERLKY